MSKKTNTINQIPSQQRSLDFGTYETGNYEDCGQHCMTDETYLITCGYLSSISSDIVGKTLTLIDSFESDEKTKEARKSIAKNLIYNYFREVRLISLKKIE